MTSGGKRIQRGNAHLAETAPRIADLWASPVRSSPLFRGKNSRNTKKKKATSFCCSCVFLRGISTNKLIFFDAGLIYIQLTRLAAIYILNSGTEESFMRQTKLILKSGKQQKAREVHTTPFISIHFMFLWRHNYQMLNSYLSRSRFLTP